MIVVKAFEPDLPGHSSSICFMLDVQMLRWNEHDTEEPRNKAYVNKGNPPIKT